MLFDKRRIRLRECVSSHAAEAPQTLLVRGSSATLVTWGFLFDRQAMLKTNRIDAYGHLPGGGSKPYVPAPATTNGDSAP